MAVHARTISTIPVFCGKDCGGNACPLIATIENGRIVRIANNPAAGPRLSGCRRGYRLASELYSPLRLQSPLIRRGERGSGDFHAASWDEALGLVTWKLAETAGTHGSHSILAMESGGSTSAMHNTGALLTRFLNLAGGASALSGNYSNEAANFILPYLFGSRWRESGFDAYTMDHADLIILWGANILEARLGSELDRAALRARDRGARIVVVDPRRTGTSRRLSAWWLPCRPGTDAALMLAVLYVLVTEGMADRGSIDRYAHGFDLLEASVTGRDGGAPKTPLWASRICGIPEEEIVRFARLYGTTKPVMLLAGYSIQRVFAGEETYRLTVALQIATGNFGRRGGSTGSLNNLLTRPRVGTLPVPPAPQPGNVRIPILRWPDAVLEGRGGGYPADIRAVYVVGCNFLNQGADVSKNIAAFRSLDFAVCHELFLTPTARFCDVVLPAAHTLEREDIGIPWAGNFLAYKPQASPPRGQSRTDYDIFSELADRMGFGAAYTEGRDAAAWIRLFLEQSEIADLEEFRRTGIYFGAERERTGLADFVRDPAAHPLDTPSGRVEIASERYRRDTGFPAIPGWQAPPAEPEFPLLLITPKAAGRTHSQVNGEGGKSGRQPSFLEICASDALRRGIEDGDRIVIRNRRGAVLTRARVTELIMPGVVSLDEGIWFELDPGGIDTAGSANMLSSTEGTRPGKAPIMHGLPVEVMLAPDSGSTPA